MALGPVAVTARELRQLLLGAAELVGRRDSFDGSLTYTLWDGPPCSACAGLAAEEEGVVCERCEGTGFEPVPEGKDYWVQGVIRDNSDGGQGFAKVVGTIRTEDGRVLSEYHAP